MATGGHFERKKNNPKKVAYWSEMARNAIESGGHFVKKNQKKRRLAYWSEMARNAIESDFQSSKMTTGGQKCPTADILLKTIPSKIKVACWSEMAILWKTKIN